VVVVVSFGISKKHTYILGGVDTHKDRRTVIVGYRK